jgi:DNA-binding GntR family transcriptional regulator
VSTASAPASAPRSGSGDSGLSDAGPSRSAQLYLSLRELIILGRYPQGSPLSEQRVAEDLNVSRVPVREAMPLLHNEGFVEVAPRRRAVVSTWTPQRVHDLFDTRLGLEVAAAGAAARRVRNGDPTGLQALERSVASAEHQLATADAHPLGQADVNCTIHLALVAAAGNELMDTVMRAVGGRMLWLFYLTSHRDLHVQSDEHTGIVEALRAGNDRLAETLTYAHIEAGREPTLRVLADNPVEPWKR